MKDNLHFTITISVILIFLGITLISINFIKEKRQEVFSFVNLSLLEEKIEGENIDVDNVDNEPITEIVEEDKVEETYVYEYYLATLKIPKINLDS